MRCDRCHRRLRNPGVPVTVGGVPLFGPVCAAKLAPPKRKAENVRNYRVRRVDQPDLFSEAGL